MRFGAQVPHRRDESACWLRGLAVKAFDPGEFRGALGRFATGVTIVTTRDGGGRAYGVTANSYNSVSLDPPLVLWSLARNSRSFEAFRQCEAFAVHILGTHQQELATRFASRNETDKFAGLDVRDGHGGAPLFDDCAARFECAAHDCFDGGDHVIFLGRVVAFEARDKEPLIFHEGRFRSFAATGADA